MAYSEGGFHLTSQNRSKGTDKSKVNALLVCVPQFYDLLGVFCSSKYDIASQVHSLIGDDSARTLN